MRCYRCNRAVSHEVFHIDEGNFWGWRCIFCGEILGEMVLENRQQLNPCRQERTALP